MAVIGIGTMGKKYAKMIQEGRISGMCLGAVCCRSHESSQWAKAELGGELPVFQDTEKLFDASELFDACLIVTPHKLHPEVIIQAFDKGKHIFCDKPIGVSMGQCLKIRQKAEEKDLVFAMMYHQRMYPKYERIHELLESGTLGQIRRILMENSRYYRTWHYHKSGSWRSSWRGEGGGALLNQGQHLLDIWQWLFGMPESLYALIPYGKYNDFSVDDEATIVMKYPDKKTAVFILTTGEGTWTERLEIVGSKGTLLLEDSHLTLHQYDRDLEEYKRTASCNSREELKERLVSEGNGLYRLRDAYVKEESRKFPGEGTRFVVSGEISSIYKKNGKTRKVHNVILLPSLEAADAMAQRLEKIGNIHSDGRPILGLDSHDLLEMMLDVCPEGILIPAHIWTPHFSVLGAKSGFDSVEECFEELAPYIHALETGLSSDPAMNWRISKLDRYQLVSNSDAHSPSKLGREANLLDIDCSYEGLYRAIQTGEGLEGTVEFFPEEGKYHFDGHRKCGVSLSPVEAERLGGICPVCGKKLTMGVDHRVEQLADRAEGFVKKDGKKYESLVPLPEVISACMGYSTASKKVQGCFEQMIQTLGTEFDILRNVPSEDIKSCAGEGIAEGIEEVRTGNVKRIPGYDGEYGKIELFDEN